MTDKDIKGKRVIAFVVVAAVIQYVYFTLN